MQPLSRYLDRMTKLNAVDLTKSPLDALRDIAESAAHLEELRRHQVAEARRSGATWDEIGSALGMSRQAAWEYFRKRARERLAETARSNSDLSEEEALELAVEEARAARRERKNAQ